MNDGDSAGGGQQGHSPAPPAVFSDRRSNYSGTTQISNVGSAVPTTQMSRDLNIDRITQQQQHLQSIASRSSLHQQQQQQPIHHLHHQQIQQHQHHYQQQHQIQSIHQNTSSNIQQNNPSLGSSNSINSGGLLRTHSVVLSTTSGNIINSSNVYVVSTSPSSSSSSSSSSASSSAANNPSTTDLALSSIKKRLKLNEDFGSGTGGNTLNDISSLKKRILEHKYSRLKNVKDKYSEHVAELFFLQTGNNMMEYPVWRKKSKSPQFLNFMKSYRLEPPPLEESVPDLIPSRIQSQPSVQVANLPHGAEIKIPGVGVTPVAVSTTLPAAVVQLSQQGNIPGRPQGGRHGMVFGQIPVPLTIGSIPVPLVPGGTPLVLEPPTGHSSPADKRKAPMPINVQLVGNNISISSTSSASTTSGTVTNSSTTGTAGSTQEQFSVKAKQEVYVMQRVSELQRDGLWTERRLPKIQEPQRPKAHWDYLLEEMVWLAADFAQERKWKKAAAKKCARMVQKHFQDKAMAAQKAEKAQELQLKRIASFLAKEVKIFWSNVEKLVEYKQHTKLEEKRKKALDQHLSFIVDQTEKFSLQLAEGMNKPATDANVSAVPSVNSSRISSPKPSKNASDDEFSPGNASSDDDEETIAKAEEEATDVKDEVAALQKESEMDLDAFLSELPKDYLQQRDKIILSEDKSTSEESDEEFHAIEDSGDDEDTIMEQEQNENKLDHKMEIDELNAENNMSIEELMQKYKAGGPRAPAKMDIARDSDDSSSSEESDTESEHSENDDADSAADASDADKLNESFGLKSLLEEESNKNQSQSDKDDLINDAAAIAESIQPKGNTLSSTDVVTPVPFLLKHTLREYQHIGLDWLVTMHDRKLNGILADEMGLGKTIQTISLLAHLACVNGNWGPHLIVVPSSVMLNWEMEFKKWCPGFKILTYYGTQKERKHKRVGWTKINAFHICITSYKLVIQDHQSFRRKKWKYLILDEAQNIKNFKSQRWQLLLNFATEQRLLLTGTPLQNNLMELWSLMHFLMPHVFQSHKEFKEWFSNPMTGMIEGNSEYNDSIIKRLHKVLRPFLLRRLKSEVEKQMPKKYEHVVMCRLSNRQRFLYDDFMSRAKTKETLETGNLLSVINVLMQLRKVCNHPNMFEVRPTISPFRMDGLSIRTASVVYNMLNYDPFNQIDLNSINLVLVQLELCLTAYVAHRCKKLQSPKKLIEEIESIPEPPPRCPTGKFKMHVRIRDSRVQNNISISSGVKVGTSPAMKTEGTTFVSNSTSLVNKKSAETFSVPMLTHSPVIINQMPPLTTSTPSQLPNMSLRKRTDSRLISSPTQMAHLVQTTTGRHIILTPSSSGTTTVVTQSGQRLTVVKSTAAPQHRNGAPINKPIMKVSPLVTNLQSSTSQLHHQYQQQPIAAALAQQLKNHSYSSSSAASKESIKNTDETDATEFLLVDREQQRKEKRMQKLQFLSKTNHRRCDATPIYGSDLRDVLVGMCTMCGNSESTVPWSVRSRISCQQAGKEWSLSHAIKSYEERAHEMQAIFNNFVIYVPAVSAPEPYLHISHPHPSKLADENQLVEIIHNEISPRMALLHPIISAMNTQFPDPRLIQYDCGKLQTLNRLLRQLKSGNHRVLIFTQMTRMLDVLEAFLNYHGHIYLRLDGTTKIEQRQVLMDRFNNDKRIFVFILSTRSGGVGVNLTGADTVIFYDSDWNPTMDAQAQDRCHRIGQTRDVHIYRLVSEKTIEENILKKANQKRLLGDLAIEGGNFTTAYFKSTTIQDLFAVDNAEDDASARLSEVLDRDRDRRMRLQENLVTGVAATSSNIGDDKSAIGAFESALAAAEDEQDVQAAKIASAEADADLAEFDESIPIEDGETSKVIAPEISKAEQEVENLVKQLSPIERYAMRFVEETGGSWTAEQLRAAEAEIEQQKREWEANRLAALKKEEEEAKRNEDEENELLTYSREDAKNQVNNRSKPINRRLLTVKGMNNRRRGIKRRVGAAASRKRGGARPNNRSPAKRQKLMSNSLSRQKNRRVQKTNKSKRIQERTTPRRTCRLNTTNAKSNSVVGATVSKNITDDNDSYSNETDNDDSQDSTNGTLTQGAGTEEFDDSECSLDVMYDSTDVQESDSNTTQTSTSPDDDDDDEEEDDDASDNGSNDDTKENHGKSNDINNRRESIHNRVDINSPRTRSRGTVKLNLWTLDVSPILPDIKSNKKKSKNISNDTSSSTATNHNNSADDSMAHNEHDGNTATEEEDSQINSSANTDLLDAQKPTAAVRQAKILDGFSKLTPKSSKKSVTRKLITNNGKNHTLDKWISKSPRTMRALSPKVMLSKDEITKHFNQVAAENSIRKTRRTSILRINSENGPS